MNATIIDGKALSGKIREALKVRVEALTKKGIVPGLSVILVGEDPASQVYVRNKEKASAEIGMNGIAYRLPEQTSEEEIITLIRKLNSDPSVHGILVQLPLPGHLNELKILTEVDPQKDVDGIHIHNAGSLLVGRKGFVPCTPKGVIKLIESTGNTISGKRAVVVGRSILVGKPVALLLLDKNATVSICHSRTQDLGAVTREADILVSAVGSPQLIKGDMIKPGAVVIDVGTTKVDGKLTGDIKFDEAVHVADYITPVPGGVGPMTITMLLENTIEAAEAYGNI